MFFFKYISIDLDQFDENINCSLLLISLIYFLVEVKRPVVWLDPTLLFPSHSYTYFLMESNEKVKGYIMDVPRLGMQLLFFLGIACKQKLTNIIISTLFTQRSRNSSKPMIWFFLLIPLIIYNKLAKFELGENI